MFAFALVAALSERGFGKAHDFGVSNAHEGLSLFGTDRFNYFAVAFVDLVQQGSLWPAKRWRDSGSGGGTLDRLLKAASFADSASGRIRLRPEGLS